MVLERRFSPGAVSATKYTLILLAAGVLLMAAEPARALAASVHETRASTQAHPADTVVVLAPGSGYGGGTDATRVRSLQRRLDSAGFTPGPIDGLFGPRTEDAVELFQRAHGLRRRRHRRAGHVLGPAHAIVVLFPGAGYAGVGSRQVRGLQRQLRHDGFSPGPIDGRYGPLTERAVSRFQSANGLKVDGIAGSQTFGELTAHRGWAATRPASTLDGAVESPTDASPEAVASGHAATQSAGEDRSEFPRPD